jgi:nitroreductase/dihydropteridine reductase
MLIEHLEFRYATKKFDSTKDLSLDLFNQILEAGRLAPSSFGLQPYRFFQIPKNIRIDIQASCFNQPQIIDAPILIAIQSKTSITKEDINEYLELIMTERGISRESLLTLESMILNFIKNIEPNVLFWTQKQAAISLGFMLATAAE